MRSLPIKRSARSGARTSCNSEVRVQQHDVGTLKRAPPSRAAASRQRRFCDAARTCPVGGGSVSVRNGWHSSTAKPNRRGMPASAASNRSPPVIRPQDQRGVVPGRRSRGPRATSSVVRLERSSASGGGVKPGNSQREHRAVGPPSAARSRPPTARPASRSAPSGSASASRRAAGAASSTSPRWSGRIEQDARAAPSPSAGERPAHVRHRPSSQPAARQAGQPAPPNGRPSPARSPPRRRSASSRARRSARTRQPPCRRPSRGAFPFPTGPRRADHLQLQGQRVAGTDLLAEAAILDAGEQRDLALRALRRRAAARRRPGPAPRRSARPA